MKYYYKMEHRVNYTDCDKTIALGLTNAVDLLQNNSTEFFGTFHSDNVSNKNENNSVWVLTKSITKVNKFPKWEDTITLNSYISSIKPVRVNVTTAVTDKNNELLFVSKQEMCPIDVTERKIRKISTVNFPEDMDKGEELILDPFSKVKYDFKDEDKIYSRKVLATDIDFSNHCNNVKYINYMMDSMPSKFIDENNVTEFEIHYIKECLEGDLLDIYRQKVDDKLEFLIKRGEDEIVRAFIKYSPKAKNE